MKFFMAMVMQTKLPKGGKGLKPVLGVRKVSA